MCSAIYFICSISGMLSFTFSYTTNSDKMSYKHGLLKQMLGRLVHIHHHVMHSTDLQLEDVWAEIMSYIPRSCHINFLCSSVGTFLSKMSSGFPSRCVTLSTIVQSSWIACSSLRSSRRWATLLLSFAWSSFRSHHSILYPIYPIVPDTGSIIHGA